MFSLRRHTVSASPLSGENTLIKESVLACFYFYFISWWSDVSILSLLLFASFLTVQRRVMEVICMVTYVSIDAEEQQKNG